MKRATIITALLLFLLTASAGNAEAAAFPRIVEDAAASGLHIAEDSPIHLPEPHIAPIVPPAAAGVADGAERYGAASTAEADRLDTLREKVAEIVHETAEKVSEEADFEEVSLECAKEGFKSAANAVNDPAAPVTGTSVRDAFEQALAGCIAGALESKDVPEQAAEQFAEPFARYLTDAVSEPVAGAAREASGTTVWATWLTQTGDGLEGTASDASDTSASHSTPTDPGRPTPWGTILAVLLLAVGAGTALYYGIKR